MFLAFDTMASHLQHQMFDQKWKFPHEFVRLVASILDVGSQYVLALLLKYNNWHGSDFFTVSSFLHHTRET